MHFSFWCLISHSLSLVLKYWHLETTVQIMCFHCSATVYGMLIIPCIYINYTLLVPCKGQKNETYFIPGTFCAVLGTFVCKGTFLPQLGKHWTDFVKFYVSYPCTNLLRLCLSVALFLCLNVDILLSPYKSWDSLFF